MRARDRACVRVYLPEEHHAQVGVPINENGRGGVRGVRERASDRPAVADGVGGSCAPDRTRPDGGAQPVSAAAP